MEGKKIPVENLQPLADALERLIQRYQENTEALTQLGKEYYGDGETVSRHRWVMTQRRSSAKTAMELLDLEQLLEEIVEEAEA